MRLTSHTDYSLRTLMFLAVHDNRLSTVGEIAATYGISRNHLVKVVGHLTAAGYVEATRGNGGGVRLARPAAEINVGEVVRRTEADQDLVECFRPAGTCIITTGCLLRPALKAALRAFFEVLDGYTLQDLLGSRPLLEELLAVG